MPKKSSQKPKEPVDESAKGITLAKLQELKKEHSSALKACRNAQQIVSKLSIESLSEFRQNATKALSRLTTTIDKLEEVAHKYEDALEQKLVEGVDVKFSSATMELLHKELGFECKRFTLNHDKLDLLGSQRSKPSIRYEKTSECIDSYSFVDKEPRSKEYVLNVCYEVLSNKAREHELKCKAKIGNEHNLPGTTHEGLRGGKVNLHGTADIAMFLAQRNVSDSAFEKNISNLSTVMNIIQGACIVAEIKRPDRDNFGGKHLAQAVTEAISAGTSYRHSRFFLSDGHQYQFGYVGAGKEYFLSDIIDNPVHVLIVMDRWVWEKEDTGIAELIVQAKDSK